MFNNDYQGIAQANCYQGLYTGGGGWYHPGYEDERTRRLHHHAVVMKVLDYNLNSEGPEEAARKAKAAADILYPPPAAK